MTTDPLLLSKLCHLCPPKSKTLIVGKNITPLLEALSQSNPQSLLIGLDQQPNSQTPSKENTYTLLSGTPKTHAPTPVDTILLPNTLLNYPDAQTLLEELIPWSHTKTRLILTFPNNLWNPFLQTPMWLSSQDIKTLLHLSGWEPFTYDATTLLPSKHPLCTPINRWVAPTLPALLKSLVLIARRPTPKKSRRFSLVIPVRNEEGNIPNILPRIPHLSPKTEILFVEGHSQDQTWKALQKLPLSHQGREIRLLQQTGRGKGDAVRLGFQHATGDLLGILDGDLTMPPEELPKFIKALENGQADFANGSRLVYLMQKEAMQTANFFANKGFGLAFSWLLRQPLKDTLCGTKCLWANDYRKIAENRSYFGEIDPFGDFDLLFGAAKLHLKILDIPIHYKSRTYGETNIKRWQHGLLLAKMLVLATKRLRFHPLTPKKVEKTLQNP